MTIYNDEEKLERRVVMRLAMVLQDGVSPHDIMELLEGYIYDTYEFESATKDVKLDNPFGNAERDD